MRVEVAAYVVVAMAVGAAATIHSWNPNWEFKQPGREARVVVGTAPPPGAPASPAERRSHLPSSGSQPARSWTVAVGTTAPSLGSGGAPDAPQSSESSPPQPGPKTDAGSPGAAPSTDASNPSNPPAPRSHHSLGPAPADTAVASAASADAAANGPRPTAAAPASIPEAIRAAAAEPDPNRPRSGKLSVARVEYDDLGEVVLEGSATAGSRVRVRLDGASMGEVQADAEGRWRLQPDRPVASGQYQLEAEEVDGDGNATAMVALPFAKADNTADLPKPDSLVVQPGNSLWRLAERLYGDGFQYVRIFAANRDQIRDPDLIYPGQIFQIPAPPSQGDR